MMPAVDAEQGVSWHWVTGLVTAGVGVAAIGAASFLATRVDAKNDEIQGLSEEAGDDHLSYSAYQDLEQRRVSLNDSGTQLNTLQWIAFGVGAGLTATGAGLILWDLLSAPEPGPASAESGVVVGLTPTGVSLQGRW